MSRQRFGFLLGLALFAIILVLPTPEGLSRSGQNAAAVTALMACWWITEALPIYATSFIPLALFPLLGILDARSTAANFGDYLVVMLLCALIIAKAIEQNQLHKRIALSIIKLIGVSKRRILFSCMLATTLLSMWLSNLAVSLMMLPIGMALLHHIPEKDRASPTGFQTALMLSIAYAANIGGVGTLVGTPPNLVFAGILKNLYPEAPEISFFRWMLFGLPLVAIFLPICWLYMVKFFRVKGTLEGSRETVDRELAALGPMSKAEKRTAFVCLLTICGWVFRKDLVIGSFTITGWASLLDLGDFVNDATVAALSMVLLFIIPSGAPRKDGKGSAPKLMNWESAATIPWGVVMIVAGGYCIASGFNASGLTDWIGANLSFISQYSVLMIVLLIVLGLSFLTEINSNTATSNIFLPILASMAAASGINPLLFMVPGTVACSYAFMLPSGAGPNSVAFASGQVSLPTMARCGLLLNLIGVVLVTSVMYLLAIPVFEITRDLPIWAR